MKTGRQVRRGRKWQRIRKRILNRDGWRCQLCGRPGRLEVDHIVPVSRGGRPYRGDNLQALCRACHVEKTRRENERVDPDRAAWRTLVSEMT